MCVCVRVCVCVCVCVDMRVNIYTWAVKRDAPVSECLPPHLHRTCVCGTARVCVGMCV